MKFEEALNKLEKIVEDLESGGVSLEKSIQKFEEGMKLVKFCSRKLQEVEKKVEMIIKDSKGNINKVPFSSKESKNEEKFHLTKADEEIGYDLEQSEDSSFDDELLF